MKAVRSPAAVQAAASSSTKKPLPEASKDPTLESLRRFRQIFAAVRTHFRQVEQVTGTGTTQLRAPSLPRERPGLRISELAGAMDIHQSIASDPDKAMVDRRPVSGLRNGQDARVLRMSLQPAGEQVLQRLPSRVLRSMNADLDLLLAAMQTDATTAKSPLALF